MLPRKQDNLLISCTCEAITVTMDTVVTHNYLSQLKRPNKMPKAAVTLLSTAYIHVYGCTKNAEHACLT